jgi:hypothetical protein
LSAVAAMALAYDATRVPVMWTPRSCSTGIVIEEARHLADDLGLPSWWLNEQGKRLYLRKGRPWQAARSLAGGRTAVFISHRFSTARKADRIFLFHEGRLAEQGTHSELMRLAGRYAELFTLQASAYVD